MALTKDDIQAISDLMDDKLDNKLAAALKPLETRMDGFEARMDGFEARMDGFEARMDGFETKMDGFEAKLESIEESLQITRESQIIVETVWLPRISLALEAIEGSIEKNKEQDKRIDALEKSSDYHSVQISAIKAQMAHR